ncbi:MAG TPA: C4-type zinc ribbon domain-containing protein [Candidatus Binatia bacterium]|nr:C4-type zinc ribbon domain-containing protein [Candidatus Binatia bacterium]
MATQIEILASLQTVDREIKECSERKLGLLNELQAREQEIAAKKSEIAALAAAVTEKEKLRLEKDAVFQDEGKKAMDKRMRMNRIKNAKELQAVQREIEQIKQNNSVLEEEILRIMEEIDQIKAQMRVKEAELAALHEAWQSQQQVLSEEIASLDATVSAAMARRRSIAAQVAADLISRYELIFSRRGGTAVVEVAAGICQGCYMNIPPQLWNEIIRREKVHLCPSCQRMLYFRPEPLPEAKSA